MPALSQPQDSELDELVAYLGQQRYFLRLAAHGLTDEEARLVPSASALSVGGLVKHLAGVEEFWAAIIDGRHDPRTGGETDYEASFRLAPPETLQGVLAAYATASGRTDRVVRSHRAGDKVKVPHDVPWFPSDVDYWSVRWTVLHLIEETARHAGHADIIRESIDGAQAFPLMASAECWPESPWVKPWAREQNPATSG